MSTNDIEAVEEGWSVATADGHKIGKVKEVTETAFVVTPGLFGGDERYLPVTSLEHVKTEFKEIELSLTRDEVESGDWSRPPAQGPRSSGAPLNTG